MKRHILLQLCLISLTIGSSYSQCLLKHIPLNNKINNSTHIVEGKVIQKTSFWDAGHKNIYTSNKIEVYKIFKGSIQGNYIEIITEGGQVGNDLEMVDPSLQLSIGETGIFTCNYTNINIPFTYTSSIPQFDAYASLQGFIKYDLNSIKAAAPFETYSDITTVLYPAITSITNNNYQTIKKVTFSPSSSIQVQASISNISPTTATAGTKTQLTISGSGFGSTQGAGYVEFKDANSGGASNYQPLASEYVSWNDNTIVIEIPSRAGTGTVNVVQGGTATSGQTLTISYSQLNVTYDPGSGDQAYQPDHIDDNGSGGYTFSMYTGFDGNASAKASFLRALDTWRCNTGVNWTNGSTTSTDVIASDGENVVRFDIGTELPGGVLGRCTSRWSGCGAPLTWYVTELDVAFDDGTSWEFGPALPGFTDYDFETVAVHELGHGHQLGHVISPGAIMHYSISNGTSNRSLGVNDQAGGDYVQGQSTAANACGPGAMTNYTCGSTPVADFSASSTSVCNGSSVTFTDMSSNTPTSWAWAFQGGSPSTSTVQNPSITYNTPGVYSVTLTATNASGSDDEIKVGYITITACTQLSPSDCGRTLSSLDNFIYPVNIPGAQYEFQFVHAATSFTTSIYVGQSGACKVSKVNGLQYGKTYDVSVRAYVSGAWSSYGSVCQLTTPAVAPVPQLGISDCGKTLSSLNEFIYCTGVSGATYYEFRFIHAATSFTTTFTSGPGRSCNVSHVSGIQYNKTYDVDVRAQVGGVWGNYGSACQIITPAVTPTPQLSISDCGRTLTSLSEYIYCTNVNGATYYEFRFIHAATSYTATFTVGTGRALKVLKVPGIQNGKTYDVDVRAQVGGAWGNYGAVCQVTTPGAGIIPVSNVNSGNLITISPGGDQSFFKAGNESEDVENSTIVNLFPNPSNDGNITINILNSGIEENVLLSLFDMSGRELYNQVHPAIPGTMNIIQPEFSPLALSNGIYILRVNIGNKQIFNKLIIE